MCRFLGYLGPPTTLEELLMAPKRGLLRQSWQPRHQLRGTINADGFGVGWYEPSLRDEPARYRTSKPMWADRSFESLAGLVTSGAVLAAVRSATPPIVAEEANVPPFSNGSFLFVHNGAVEGFREGISSRLRRTLSELRDSQIAGTTDSETLFALMLDRLDEGSTMPQALVSVANEVRRHAAATLNMIATDGHRLTALAAGDSLFTLTRETPSGTARYIASEPFDDDPVWRRIEDGHLVEVDDGALSVTALDLQEGIAAG